MTTIRFAALLVVLSTAAFAQTPNGFVTFPEPPEGNGASYTTYPRHALWNGTLNCLQRSTPTSWQCLTTASETAAAQAAAVSQAATNAAALYVTTTTANTAFAALNGRVDSTDANVATAQGQISSLQTGATTLSSRVTTLETTSATKAAVAASAATLNTRIDGVVASIPTVVPDTVCANATITGLSIPLTGISTTTTIPVTGAIAGYPCVVGNPSFLPLGAKGVCIASAANTVQMRFEAGGLLSSVLSIPSGTYRACVLVRP